MRTGEVQGALWGAKADDWAEVQEPAWRPLYETILRRAGVGPGMRLLDIGCGAGGFLVEANKVRADIAGLDASEALVAIARRRLPHASIHVGEMEELPFDGQSFDLVTGINSFQFAGDVVAALKEAGRVCRAGGKVLMLVWGRKQDCDLLTAIMPAVSALLPPAGSSATSVAFAEPGVIERLMREAGLTPLTAEEVSHSLTYSDTETTWRAIAAAAPGVRAVRHAGMEKVKDAVTATLAPFTQDDGSVVLRNRFRLVMSSTKAVYDE
jgi:ubiquinone/menaquinone biosynthesis C-methylase UbiE